MLSLPVVEGSRKRNCMMKVNRTVDYVRVKRHSKKDQKIYNQGNLIETKLGRCCI